MRLITNAELHRGAAIIDYAFSNEDGRLNLTMSDMIGVVGAYLNRDLTVKNMEEELSIALCPNIARRAIETFKFFAVDRENRDDGLWFLGSASDDVRIIHPTLKYRFPHVNGARRKTGIRS